MIIENETMVTDAVIRALRGTPDPRHHDVYASLVRHLHAFVRDVRLTQDELETAVRFLASLGHYTNNSRNEMMQAFDVLGVSTLVALLHHPLTEVETAAAVMGPFYRAEPAPLCESGESISRGDDEGEPLVVEGICRSAHGQPIEGAMVEVWQASPGGLYDNQDPSMPHMNFRGRFASDEEGRYRFATLRPAGYPVPTDGPIGALLDSQRRHPFRPAHIHFIVHAPGFETVITQLYVDEIKALEEDVVFAVTPPLIAEAVARAGGVTTIAYDFTLKPGESVLPQAPIP
ncbi:dioxygenase [Spirillospora sp. CA-255316]